MVHGMSLNIGNTVYEVSLKNIFIKFLVKIQALAVHLALCEALLQS